jgi:hypothetical protein
MARIHTLPVMLQGEAGRRLTDELVATLKAGEDPGPRRHQIEVLQNSIRAALQALPQALASAAGALPSDHPTRCAAEHAVRRYMDEIEALVAMVEPEASIDLSPCVAVATR